MSHYIKGLETKNRILEVAEKLFYENGYYNTKFTDICREAKVHPGSLNHLFGEYKNIAAFLVTKNMEFLYQQLSEIFPELDDKLILNMLAYDVYIHRFFEDEKFRRFNTEFDMDLASRGNGSKYYDLYDESVIKGLKHHYCEHYSSDFDEMDMDYYFHAISGIDGPVEAYLCSKIECYTPDIALRHYFNIFFSYFRFSKEEMEEMLKKTKELYGQVTISGELFKTIILKKS